MSLTHGENLVTKLPFLLPVLKYYTVGTKILKLPTVVGRPTICWSRLWCQHQLQFPVSNESPTPWFCNLSLQRTRLVDQISPTIPCNTGDKVYLVRIGECLKTRWVNCVTEVSKLNSLKVINVNIRTNKNACGSIFIVHTEGTFTYKQHWRLRATHNFIMFTLFYVIQSV